MLRIAGLPVWVGPSDVIAGTRAVLGWGDEAVHLAAALPRRITDLLDDADGLVGRITAVADRADALVAQADGIVRSVDDLLDGVRSTLSRVDEVLAQATEVTDGAAGLMRRADGVTDGAAGLVTRAGSVTERADAIVEQATGASAGATELLATYQPIARQAAPLAKQFVTELSTTEVHAAIRLVDQLPQLAEHLEQDILPILATLDRVGPDVHELLDQLKEVRQAILGIPGFDFFRRRGGRDGPVADPNA